MIIFKLYIHLHLYIVSIECYCGKVDRTIPCKEDQKDVKNYSCEQVCDKVLSCGNHNCKETCHPGECPPCVKAPDQVKCCPCGKTKLEIVRTSCLDPIPCCEKVCFYSLTIQCNCLHDILTTATRIIYCRFVEEGTLCVVCPQNLTFVSRHVTRVIVLLVH